MKKSLKKKKLEELEEGDLIWDTSKIEVKGRSKSQIKENRHHLWLVKDKYTKDNKHNLCIPVCSFSGHPPQKGDLRCLEIPGNLVPENLFDEVKSMACKIRV